MTRQILTEKIDQYGGERYTVVTGTELDHEVEGAFYDKAEAQLHLAAPELLAALERMLAAHDADVEAGSLIAAGNGMAAAQARQAIAKATGKVA